MDVARLRSRCIGCGNGTGKYWKRRWPIPWPRQPKSGRKWPICSGWLEAEPRPSLRTWRTCHLVAAKAKWCFTHGVSDATRSLDSIQKGEAEAREELLPLVYDELRRLAAAKMAREAPGQTLQPTALVHEAWLRLGADSQPNWQNRAHFLGA